MAISAEARSFLTALGLGAIGESVSGPLIDAIKSAAGTAAQYDAIGNFLAETIGSLPEPARKALAGKFKVVAHIAFEAIELWLKNILRKRGVNHVTRDAIVNVLDDVGDALITSAATAITEAEFKQIIRDAAAARKANPTAPQKYPHPTITAAERGTGAPMTIHPWMTEVCPALVGISPLASERLAAIFKKYKLAAARIGGDDPNEPPFARNSKKNILALLRVDPERALAILEDPDIDDDEAEEKFLLAGEVIRDKQGMDADDILDYLDHGRYQIISGQKGKAAQWLYKGGIGLISAYVLLCVFSALILVIGTPVSLIATIYFTHFLDPVVEINGVPHVALPETGWLAISFAMLVFSLGQLMILSVLWGPMRALKAIVAKPIQILVDAAEAVMPGGEPETTTTTTGAAH